MFLTGLKFGLGLILAKGLAVIAIAGLALIAFAAFKGARQP